MGSCGPASDEQASTSRFGFPHIAKYIGSNRPSGSVLWGGTIMHIHIYSIRPSRTKEKMQKYRQ